MNLKDLIAKMTAIEEGVTPPLAPEHTDGAGAGDSYNNDVEECGMPVAIGGPAPQDNHVTMNISMNGTGSDGVRNLMNILKDIENGETKPHMGHEHEPEAPLMGSMVRAMGQEEDVGEEYENSMYGHDGTTEFGMDAITQTGDDLASQGKGALKHNGGENPMHESLVNRLSQMYAAIKEERTEEKDEKGNVVRWKEETPWRKAEKKDGRGKVTNMSDKARRETEKMSKKETEVAEGHSDDDEEKKIRHLMRKYGWSHQEALEYYHYEQHDPKDYEDMEESAKWRDPKYKGQLFTQEPRDHDKYDYSDDEYYNGPRPTNDPGDKYSTFDRDSRWTDPLYARHSLPKDHNDPESWGYGSVSSKGKSKGKVTASHKNNMKNNIQGSLGQHHTPNLPEQMNESAEVNAMLALNKRLNG